MRYYVIGDSDTVLGFAYAGVKGEVAPDAAAARSALLRVVNEEPETILIITDAIAESIRDDVNQIRFDLTLPLVVEIPGPDGPIEKPNLLKLIQEAVGIRV